MVIGDLYNKSSWTSIGSGITQSGGFSIVGDKIRNAADGTGANNIVVNFQTALDRVDFSVAVKWITDAASGSLVKIGMASANPNITESLFAELIAAGTDKGKIKVTTTWPSGGTTYTSPTAVTFAVGDIVRLGMRKTTPDGFLGKWTAYVSVNGGTEMDFFRTDFYWNGSTPHIYATQNIFEIQNIALTSDLEKFANFGALGDSITFGGSATDHTKRWIELVGCTASSGGPGDRTSDFLGRLGDVNLQMNPHVLYILGGTNDASASVSPSTVVSNLQAMVTSIETYLNITRCIILTPPPNDSFDATPYRDAIAAAFPSKYIDIFTPLKATSGTGYNSLYRDDGTHPNDAGHQKIADTILASPLSVLHSNLFEGPNCAVAKSGASFAAVGITADNTAIIYKVTESGLQSYVPGRGINGIQQFETDAGYYIVCKTDISLPYYLFPTLS